VADGLRDLTALLRTTINGVEHETTAYREASSGALGDSVFDVYLAPHDVAVHVFDLAVARGERLQMNGVLASVRPIDPQQC
jgi:hypothetical protein